MNKVAAADGFRCFFERIFGRENGGNAVCEVKLAADLVIGGNDEDGIADYLEDVLLQENR